LSLQEKEGNLKEEEESTAISGWEYRKTQAQTLSVVEVKGVEQIKKRDEPFGIQTGAGVKELRGRSARRARER